MWQIIKCLFGVHDLLRRISPNKISMACIHCPHETEGWTLTPKKGQIRI